MFSPLSHLCYLLEVRGQVGDRLIHLSKQDHVFTTDDLRGYSGGAAEATESRIELRH